MSAYPLSQLGDVAHVVAGDPAPQNPQAFAADGPLFVRMQDVGRHHRHPALSDSADRLSTEWVARSRLRLFPRDSILIPKSGASVNLNHRVKLATDAYVVSHLAIVIPDRTMIEPDYLYWWSVAYDPRAQAQVTSLPSLKLSTLKAAKIPLPPLDEQRRIVGILNRAARIERLRARAEERLREFIPALFVKMFGDPSVNPLYRGVAQLGEVCTVVGGGTPRRSNGAYFGGSILWATPTDVTALVGLSIESTRETLTETGLRESSARLIPAGTVLLTSRATIGYTAIAAAPMATNQGFANLTCGERLLPEYLAFWLRLRRNHLVQLAGGTTFKEISKSSLKKIEIPLPPLELQYCFANLIASVIRVISKTEIASDSAARLSTSLISRLLRAAA